METQLEPTSPAPTVPAPTPDPLLDEIADILDAIREQNTHIIDSLDTIKAYGDKRNTKIIDFNMPFFALVGLLVKISIASIPAFIILGVLGVVLAALASAFFTTLLLALSQSN